MVQEFIRRYSLIDYEETEEARRSWEAQCPGEFFEEAHTRNLELFGGPISVFYVLDPVKWIVDLHAKVRQRGGPLYVAHIIVRAGYPGPLPYGLEMGTDIRGFKIGRLLDKSKLTYDGAISHSRSFFHDDLSVTVVFDEPSNHLSFLKIEAVDPADMARLRFYDGLDAQKANLVPVLDASIEQWRSASPLHHWRQRMAEGDSAFSDANLQLTADEINALFASVGQAVEKRSPKQIINALKKTVKNLNRLNRRNGHFIETTEREELVPYLQMILRDTGLQFEDGFDVTLEWRDW
ncbi:hypothetical protein [Ottowia thiooxydans]|uniref:hypothetical protein n=1 Tax=Ottowia thiooxydans TaxID=219182 RepID=UPI0012EB1CD9|nr:hypothetical protein [Ottowia thiooxydans]